MPSEGSKTLEMTNKEFAQGDQEFRRWCEVAGVVPTTRQASKYRNKGGAAYAARLQGRQHGKG